MNLQHERCSTMANSLLRRSAWKMVALTLCGTVALLLTAPLVTAQDKGKDTGKDQGKMGKDPVPDDKGGKDKDQIKIEDLPNAPRVKGNLPLLNGYTRPGNPNDID